MGERNFPTTSKSCLFLCCWLLWGDVFTLFSFKQQFRNTQIWPLSQAAFDSLTTGCHKCGTQMFLLQSLLQTSLFRYSTLCLGRNQHPLGCIEARFVQTYISIIVKQPTKVTHTLLCTKVEQSNFCTFLVQEMSEAFSLYSLMKMYLSGCQNKLAVSTFHLSTLINALASLSYKRSTILQALGKRK